MKTVFLRVLEADDKAAALLEAARERNELAGVRFLRDATAFGLVPGAPFAYWVGERVLRLFGTLAPVEAEGRIARRTNGTTDDNRWIRAAWEVPLGSSDEMVSWVPHVKGGSFSAVYHDPHLVIQWDSSREAYPGYLGTVHRPDVRPASMQHFFRPGLTWPRRTDGLSFRCMPRGCIFGDKGPAVFVSDDDEEALLVLCAIVNSLPFRALVAPCRS